MGRRGQAQQRRAVRAMSQQPAAGRTLQGASHTCIFILTSLDSAVNFRQSACADFFTLMGNALILIKILTTHRFTL